MKIAIAELKTPTEILDLDYKTGGAIVGGETSGGTTVDVSVTGENTFTFADTFSETFEICGGSVTITGGSGIGIASDVPGLDLESILNNL